MINEKRDESLIIIFIRESKMIITIRIWKKRKVKKEEWERENQAIVYKRAFYVVASVAIFPPPDVWSYEVDPNGRRLGEIRLRENFQKAAKIKDTTTYQYHTWKKKEL